MKSYEKASVENKKLAYELKVLYGDKIYVRPFKSREAVAMVTEEITIGDIRKLSKLYGMYVYGFILSIEKIPDLHNPKVELERKQPGWLISLNEAVNHKDGWRFESLYEKFNEPYGENVSRDTITETLKKVLSETYSINPIKQNFHIMLLYGVMNLVTKIYKSLRKKKH